jgi:hypothetical protein
MPRQVLDGRGIGLWRLTARFGVRYGRLQCWLALFLQVYTMSCVPFLVESAGARVPSL